MDKTEKTYSNGAASPQRKGSTTAPSRLDDVLDQNHNVVCINKSKRINTMYSNFRLASSWNGVIFTIPNRTQNLYLHKRSWDFFMGCPINCLVNVLTSERRRQFVRECFHIPFWVGGFASPPSTPPTPFVVYSLVIACIQMTNMLECVAMFWRTRFLPLTLLNPTILLIRCLLVGNNLHTDD